VGAPATVGRIVCRVYFAAVGRVAVAVGVARAARPEGAGARNARRGPMRGHRARDAITVPHGHARAGPRGVGRGSVRRGIWWRGPVDRHQVNGCVPSRGGIRARGGVHQRYGVHGCDHVEAPRVGALARPVAAPGAGLHSGHARTDARACDRLPKGASRHGLDIPGRCVGACVVDSGRRPTPREDNDHDEGQCTGTHRATVRPSKAPGHQYGVWRGRSGFWTCPRHGGSSGNPSGGTGCMVRGT
jgi:hypothetical protein